MQELPDGFEQFARRRLYDGLLGGCGADDALSDDALALLQQIHPVMTPSSSSSSTTIPSSVMMIVVVVTVVIVAMVTMMTSSSSSSSASSAVFVVVDVVVVVESRWGELGIECGSRFEIVARD